jgi:hypothetical protein
VKNSPYLTLKNRAMAESMFSHVLKINEMRNNRLHDNFKRIYFEIRSLIQAGQLSLEDHTSFINGIRNHFVFKKEKERIRQALRYFPDYTNPDPAFEKIYDGRIGIDNVGSATLEIETIWETTGLRKNREE